LFHMPRELRNVGRIGHGHERHRPQTPERPVPTLEDVGRTDLAASLYQTESIKVERFHASLLRSTPENRDIANAIGSQILREDSAAHRAVLVSDDIAVVSHGTR